MMCIFHSIIPVMFISQYSYIVAMSCFFKLDITGIFVFFSFTICILLYAIHIIL